MLSLDTKRPRNVNAARAAAILYGDWGTSKAYVLGLAFAVAGYSSFWLIAAMGLLAALVGINYITICKLYPEGGGVYGSVRRRSEIISIVGAFMLIADYLVTAAMSARSAFEYFGVVYPEIFTAGAIVLIGACNYFGPKHTGGFAFLIGVPTVVIVALIGLFSLPHLGEAARNVLPLKGGFAQNWASFVGIVLALSGVEAIANTTGLMKLDPDSTAARPSVGRTSTMAIFWVMLEVCTFTVLLGLAMHALPGLVVNNHEVDAPGHPGVRDYMLRYMGEEFVSIALGTTLGHLFGIVVSIVVGALLLSAVNTAITALISIQFLMSRDGELPRGLQKLNSFGVPLVPMAIATLVPTFLVLMVKDVVGLAELYAVGVVGAIAANLGATATDFQLQIKTWERGLMFFTFAVMLAIETTLLVDKPYARVFVVTLLAVGLILRGIAKEWEQKRRPSTPQASEAVGEGAFPSDAEAASDQTMLCAIRGLGKTLDFALAEAKETGRPLYLLFIREQKVVTELDRNRKWPEDSEAKKIFNYAGQHAGKHPVRFCYAVSDSVADTIVDVAATLGVSRVLLGTPKRGALINMLRGNIIRDVAKILPANIHLLVHA